KQAWKLLRKRLRYRGRVTGKSKTTILRQANAGKFSYQIDDQGRKRVDPAEFHRVHPLPSSTDETAGSDAHRTETPPAHRSAPAETAETIALVRTMIASLDTAKAEEIRRLEETIEDLRDRLDRESAQNRALTQMITDQRDAEPKRRSWFGLLG
ncbi:MAG: hypothetical protein AAFQ22_12590, partial [Pseudomonadota bacterium]